MISPSREARQTFRMYCRSSTTSKLHEIIKDEQEQRNFIYVDIAQDVLQNRENKIKGSPALQIISKWL